MRLRGALMSRRSAMLRQASSPARTRGWAAERHSATLGYSELSATTFVRIQAHDQRCWLGLAFVAFLCRAVVPVGFMPASFDAGGPITLCPGGSAGAIVRYLSERSADNHAHHAQHEHGSDSYEAWEHCPTGASLSAAALTTAIPDYRLPPLEQVLEAIEPAQLLPSVIASLYRARAPPTA